jgi:hypothetical protein
MATPARTAATNNAMPGMEHCESMPSAAAQNQPAPQSVQAVQMGSSTICCDDLSFAKDSGTIEQTDIVLHPLADANLVATTQLPAPLQKHDRPPAWSGKTIPSSLTPLASNLRI